MAAWGVGLIEPQAQSLSSAYLAHEQHFAASERWSGWAAQLAGG
jgi:hypothetical protein